LHRQEANGMAIDQRDFDVEFKGFFPFSFRNKIETSLLYEGVIPIYDLYTDISLVEYKVMASNLNNKNKWNLNSELIR
jgi:hypothetical protein